MCSLNVTTPKPDCAKLQILIARRSLGQATQIVLSQYGTACKLPELPISIRCAALQPRLHILSACAPPMQLLLRTGQILACSLNVTTPKPDRAKWQILTNRRSLCQATQNVVSQYSTACISSELAISIGFVALQLRLHILSARAPPRQALLRTGQESLRIA